MRSQKGELKNHKPRSLYLIAQGNHRKSIKVIIVLHVKEILMAHNNRFLLVRTLLRVSESKVKMLIKILRHFMKTKD